MNDIENGLIECPFSLESLSYGVWESFSEIFGRVCVMCNNFVIIITGCRSWNSMTSCTFQLWQSQKICI